MKRGREILPFCDRDISAGRRKRRGKHCTAGKAERDVERRQGGSVKELAENEKGWEEETEDFLNGYMGSGRSSQERYCVRRLSSVFLL